VGEDGGLIAGHARILAARQPGIAEIPVMVAARKKDGLSNSGMPRLAERNPHHREHDRNFDQHADHGRERRTGLKTRADRTTRPRTA
jgi:hypothetical protein